MDELRKTQSPIFTIEMLPARHGDALWIEYGDPDTPRRILIDGGPRSRATMDRLRELLDERSSATVSGEPDIELIVVTHIDADHISGILDLFKQSDVAFTPRDVWFNAWRHLPADLLGAKQGEELSTIIGRRRVPWNRDFGGRAVMVPGEGVLPTVELADGMRLTLLAPTRTALAELRPVWEREVKKAGMVPGEAGERQEALPDRLGDREIDPEELASEPFEEDGSEANGASIAMLAEFDDKALLLTGDAHGGIIADGLRRLAAERAVSRIPVDAFKLPHHGSKFNLSAEVLDLVDCGRYLFSTNGDIFHHPDPVAVSRVIAPRSEPTLLFNYRTDTTERWDSARLRRRFRYDVVYPDESGIGLRVAL